jgi:hypothetical protein
MSPYQAVAVAVRLFAVWLGLDVLRSWASFAFVRQSDVPGLGVAVAFLVLTAFLVIVLWFFPRSIAGKLLSPDSTKPEPSASPFGRIPQRSRPRRHLSRSIAGTIAEFERFRRAVRAFN